MPLSSAFVIFFLSACSGLFSQTKKPQAIDGGVKIDVNEGLGKPEENGPGDPADWPVPTYESGVATASFTAEFRTRTVSLRADPDSNIADASIVMHPGTLRIDTDISIEEGASMTGESGAASFSSQVGLSESDNLTAAGPAVVITARPATNAAIPFQLALPILDGVSLTDSADSVNYVIIYRVYDAASGKTLQGVIPKGDIDVGVGAVTFLVTYFGAYQIAVTARPITQAVDPKPTEMQIVTKNEKEKGVAFAWGLGSFDVDTVSRVVTVNSGAKAAGNICDAFVGEAPDSMTLESSGVSDITAYSPIVPSAEASVIYVRFDCKLSSGAVSRSPIIGPIKVGQIAASVADLPVEGALSTSESLALNISGYGVYDFKWALVLGPDSSCLEAQYPEDWLPAQRRLGDVSQPLIHFAAAGITKLCIMARDGGGNITEIAKEYSWKQVTAIGGSRIGIGNAVAAGRSYQMASDQAGGGYTIVGWVEEEAGALAIKANLRGPGINDGIGIDIRAGGKLIYQAAIGEEIVTDDSGDGAPGKNQASQPQTGGTSKQQQKKKSKDHTPADTVPTDEDDSPDVINNVTPTVTFGSSIGIGGSPAAGTKFQLASSPAGGYTIVGWIEESPIGKAVMANLNGPGLKSLPGVDYSGDGKIVYQAAAGEDITGFAVGVNAVGAAYGIVTVIAPDSLTMNVLGAASSSPGGEWSTTVIENGLAIDNYSLPKIATAEAGAVMAVWTHGNDVMTSLFASGSWAMPESIAHDDCDYRWTRNPAIAAGSSNVFTVIWRWDVGDPGMHYSQFLGKIYSQGWTTPTVQVSDPDFLEFSSPSPNAESPQIAMQLGSNVAMIAWSQRDGAGHKSIWGATLPDQVAFENFYSPGLISSVGLETGVIRLAYSVGGAGVLAWEETPSGAAPGAKQIMTRLFGNVAEPQELFGTPKANVSLSSLSGKGADGVIVGWNDGLPGAEVAYVQRYKAAIDTWLDAESIAPQSHNGAGTKNPIGSFGADGRGLMVWQEGDSSLSEIAKMYGSTD
jgi:hypothetical protein